MVVVLHYLPSAARLAEAGRSSMAARGFPGADTLLDVAPIVVSRSQDRHLVMRATGRIACGECRQPPTRLEKGIRREGAGGGRGLERRELSEVGFGRAGCVGEWVYAKSVTKPWLVACGGVGAVMAPKSCGLVAL